MPWEVGQRLQGGKYVIKGVLGRGGFGITYKALEVDLGRLVVIKTLREDRSDQLEIKQFKKEAETLAKLSDQFNRHIVTVFTSFQEGDIYCLVMQFVSGENLFKAIERRKALPQTEIVPLIRQIGEALIVVHNAGIVHRDAHPGNIMLLRNDQGNYVQAVLIDFGIAKKIVPSVLTSENKHGNEGFAPYEQILFAEGRDPKIDIYTLAATLYYAVTGQFPTSSTRRLGDTPLTPPQQIIPSISNPLNQAILKGMALKKDDRPQSMQAWLAMLPSFEPVKPPFEPVNKPVVVPVQPPFEPVNKPVVVPVQPPFEPAYRPVVWTRKSPFESVNKPVVPPPPKAKPSLRTILSNFIANFLRIMPWGWLIGVLFIYLFIGYLLVMYNAPFWGWAIAVAVPVTWAVAWASALIWAVAWAVDFAGAGFGSIVWCFAWAVVVALAVSWVGNGAFGVVAVPMAAIVTMAGEKLLKSFNHFYTFLILVFTCVFGLGLGWLGHFIFNTHS